MMDAARRARPPVLRGAMPNRDRPARRDRNADRRGARAGPRSCRSRRRRHPGRRRQSEQREVLLHDTTIQALRRYAMLRDQILPAPADPALFFSHPRERLPSRRFVELSVLLYHAGGRAGGQRPAASARPSPYLRREHADQVASRGARHRAQPARARDGCSVTRHPSRTIGMQAVPEVMTLVAKRLDGLFGEVAHDEVAPTLEAWFTERLITQRDASPRTIGALPRHAAAAVALRSRDDRQAALAAGLRRSRRDADRRVPRSPRDRARQQRPDPQPAARCDPLALPLRRPAPSRTRAGDRARDRDPEQDATSANRLLPRAATRSKRSSPLRTGPPGWAVAIMRCC